MQVATAQEALFMACEMESSAIQLYTRALSLMEQLQATESDAEELSSLGGQIEGADWMNRSMTI